MWKRNTILEFSWTDKKKKKEKNATLDEAADGGWQAGPQRIEWKNVMVDGSTWTSKNKQESKRKSTNDGRTVIPVSVPVLSTRSNAMLENQNNHYGKKVNSYLHGTFVDWQHTNMFQRWWDTLKKKEGWEGRKKNQKQNKYAVTNWETTRR
jgi:hypothetical protein